MSGTKFVYEVQLPFDGSRSLLSRDELVEAITQYGYAEPGDPTLEHPYTIHVRVEADDLWELRDLLDTIKNECCEPHEFPFVIERQYVREDV